MDYINKNPQFKQMVKFHNVNTQGIPVQYKNHITRVPTLLTKNGKCLVGSEIKNWLDSLLPNNDFGGCDFGGSCFASSINGDDGDDGVFSLDDYGRSLQPAMTKELEERINQSVSDAYNNIKK
jgi:hypothetical protein